MGKNFEEFILAKKIQINLKLNTIKQFLYRRNYHIRH